MTGKLKLELFSGRCSEGSRRSCCHFSRVAGLCAKLNCWIERCDGLLYDRWQHLHHFRLHPGLYPVLIEIKASDLRFIATGTCSCEQKTHCSTMGATAQSTLWTSRVQCSLDCILLTFQRTRWTARILRKCLQFGTLDQVAYWCQCM